MKTLIINGSEAAINWIRFLAVAAEMQLGEKLEMITPDDNAIVTVSMKAAVPGASPFLNNYGPRIRYKAVNVEDAPQALEALGNHTIMGLIFSHIVGGTVSGDVVTSKSIREKLKFNKHTIDTRIGDLRTAGLVVSEVIPVGERG